MNKSAPSRRFSPVIATVAGIPIRLHPTFLILGLLVLVSAEPLPLLVMLVLVFASVTLHELAHSLVARRRGVVVKDIVLLPIGGVSEMDRLPPRPRDQLAVAIVGPLTSVAIGVTALAMAAAAGAKVYPLDLVDGALLHRLGWLNMILGGFNLLPALPLDGGRVLRALLAPRLGGAPATIAAARVGRVLAVAMIVFGVLYDVWLAVIGLFVLSGARAEEAAALMKLQLEGVRVARVMHPIEEATLDELPVILDAEAVVVNEEQPVSEAAEDVARGGRSVAVVLRNGTPVGVLRLQDVARLLR